MKLSTRTWSLISISLIVSLMVPAAGLATSTDSPSQQFTSDKNSLVDKTSETNKTFNSNAYWGLTVTVNDTDLGYVVVHGDDESTRTTNGYFQDNFEEGTSVSLEAQALTGAEFDRWSGDIEDSAYGGAAYGESRSNPLNVVIWDSDRDITAIFVKTYNLNLEQSPPGAGSILRDRDGPFRSGEKVTLTAQPKSGFLFIGWVGNIDGALFSGDQITLTMDKDRSITASFIEIPQVFDTPIDSLPWYPVPEGQLEPPVNIDLEGLDIPPFPTGDIVVIPDVFQGPWIDINPHSRAESFDEGVTEGFDLSTLEPERDFPWPSNRYEFHYDLGKTSQPRIGEKPSGRLPVSHLRKLEAVMSPGRGGTVEIFNMGPQKVTYDGLDFDLGEFPIKPTSGPDGTWEGSMVFTWMLSTYYPIKLVAKPFEGYRFLRWEVDSYLKYSLEELNTLFPMQEINIVIEDPVQNPENPVLTLGRLLGHLRIHAYFVPSSYPSQSEDALPEEDLDVDDDDTEADASPTPIDVNINITSETVEEESDCDSIVTIDYEATDTSGGSHLIDYVQLDIDGEEEYSWSGTPEPTGHYQDDFLLESDCAEVHTIQVKAINEDGETVTSTEEAKIPPFDTFFDWLVLDAPSESGCKMQLFINYEAFDLFTPENPITNVVVKANGITWHSSGSISSLSYEDSFMKLVDCGNTYTIEVIGTDSDGNKYTYRERITIPEEEPEDTPPPPSPPTPQETLYAAYMASAQCSSSGYECSCQLTVTFDGKDLTLGDYPVKQVILKVNGSEWYNSGTITETHHHNSVTRTVNCGQTFNFQLIVRNSIGQEVTSTGSITTPSP